MYERPKRDIPRDALMTSSHSPFARSAQIPLLAVHYALSEANTTMFLR